MPERSRCRQLPWGNLEYSIQESEEAECVAQVVRTRPGRGRGSAPPQARKRVLVGLECEFSACEINVDWRDCLETQILEYLK